MVRPSVDHLVAFLQPAQARHSSVGCGAVQVDDHVVLRHHQLQGADHIAAETRRQTRITRFDPLSETPQYYKRLILVDSRSVSLTVSTEGICHCFVSYHNPLNQTLGFSSAVKAQCASFSSPKWRDGTLRERSR